MRTALAILLMLITGSAWAPAQENPDFLEVFSGSLGGSWYTTGSEIATVIQEKIPGMTARVAPGGGTANPGIVQKKQGMLGLVYSGTVSEAYQGTAGFEGNPHTDLRHVISLNYMPFIWVGLRGNESVNSLFDLGDKRISPGRTGQTGLILARESLAAHDIDMDQITANGGTVSLLGDAERLNGLRDRNLDAASGLFPLDHAELQSLSLSPGVKLITMDSDRADRFIAAVPGLAKLTIPPGRFDKFQTEPVITVASVSTLICNADLSDDLVYEITKALVEEYERFNQYFAADDNVMATDPLAGKDPNFPVHPGAMKYFMEKGMVK